VSCMVLRTNNFYFCAQRSVIGFCNGDGMCSRVNIYNSSNARPYAVALLVEALRFKSEGRGFDSRWCHWNFSLT